MPEKLVRSHAPRNPIRNVYENIVSHHFPGVSIFEGLLYPVRGFITSSEDTFGHERATKVIQIASYSLRYVL